jgi:hypothetical protein
MKPQNTYRSMNIKFVSHGAFFILSLISFQNPAYSIPTQWDDARMSMRDLLNIGWQLTSHGTNRIAANSNSGNGFDVETFSFILTGQYEVFSRTFVLLMTFSRR